MQSPQQRQRRNIIKELILEQPEGEDVDYRACGYIQIECPPHEVHYKDFDIHERFHEDWDKFNIWQYVSKVEEPVVRAYSMANYPGEKGIIMLNVRVASPPPRLPDVPPGKMVAGFSTSSRVTKRRSAVLTANSLSKTPKLRWSTSEGVLGWRASKPRF